MILIYEAKNFLIKRSKRVWLQKIGSEVGAYMYVNYEKNNVPGPILPFVVLALLVILLSILHSAL